jgi:hypothetical protein
MRVVAIACLTALLVGFGHSSEVQPWMILYIGPDLLLPFTSAIAAACDWRIVALILRV